MNETVSLPEFSPLQKVIDKIGKRLTIENLDPDDFFLRRMFPKIIEEHRARYRLVGQKEQSKVNDNLTILDAASGRGYGLDILKKVFQKSKIIGVELGSEYLQKAVKKYSEESENKSYIQGDVRHLPLAGNSVDIAVAFEIIEHLPQADQPTFIQEIARTLKPGCHAYISIPYPYSMEEKSLSSGEKTRKKFGLGTNVHHLYEPTTEEMQHYFDQSGLKIKEEYGQIMVKPEQTEKFRRLNKVVPVWPMFAWWRRDDMQPQSIPPDKLALTHIYVVNKPF